MKTLRNVPHGAIKIELPDTRQQTDYTCGASCFQAVASYFGVLEPNCEEEKLARLMTIASDWGAHPHHILKGIKHYGLAHEELFDSDVETVKRYVRAGIPVMMMIQAWHSVDHRRKRFRGYSSAWDDGHWVAAIGYDQRVMYFEDPSLAASRGFLTFREVDYRWHDVGPYWVKPYSRHMQKYGIAIWKQPVRRPAYYRHATHIG
jgi:hypothetical protein